MSKQYTYKAFGLIVNSEFSIPEFIKANEAPDIIIRKGKTPAELSQVNKKGVRFQASKNEFLLEVDNIARFYVKNGSEIIIESFKGRIDKEIRLFLLGSVFGALFIQRGLLPIHGSAIKFGKSASIFSGISGVGKSSLAASFIKKGFSFLADDISVIDGNLHVIPSFPNIKLWNDIIKNLDINDKKLSKIRPKFQKYHFPAEVAFYNYPLPLQKIFIINTKNTPGFNYEEITGLQKFNVVINNTYRFRFIDGLDKKLEHFQILQNLLPTIKVYLVSRPQSPLLLAEFTDYLIDTFKLNE